MFILYNLLIQLVYLLLHIPALFNKKLSLFIKGRQRSFSLLEQSIKSTDKTFWIHVASLGEYEQGLPLMEKLKQQYPAHKLILTFFSPSGYEVKKNNNIADVTLYLPMDTIRNANRFIDLAHPEAVFFIKYEFWPNYLRQLKKKELPTYLVSGIFRADQIFFKPYGGFYRKALESFTFFFVQNEASKDLLAQLNYTNVSIVGDTRFDRVSQILEQDNTLPFLDSFTVDKSCTTLVIGSSWPVDEKMIVDYINTNQNTAIKYIFAPHNIKPEQIQALKVSIKKPVLLHSAHDGKNLSDYQVYIIDAYSLLTKAYSYADVAYVGGGFGSGIHNILEAATFGIPVIIGPKYQKFQEAKDLLKINACISVKNETELHKTFDVLLKNADERQERGQKGQEFILKNKNATQRIIQHIS